MIIKLMQKKAKNGYPFGVIVDTDAKTVQAGYCLIQSADIHTTRKEMNNLVHRLVIFEGYRK